MSTDTEILEIIGKIIDKLGDAVNTVNEHHKMLNKIITRLNTLNSTGETQDDK